MDCYYHNAVPSVAVCGDCSHPICATCRDETGICPGCRLERRIAAASAARAGLRGGVGPSNPPPGPQARPQPEAQPFWQPRTGTALATISPETRALLGLGYPLWPMAALALLDPKRSPKVRRHALQALGLNFGMFGLWIVLEGLVHVPLIGWPAFPMLAVLAPLWLVATFFYGFKVWHGDDVRVPLVSDWIDQYESTHAPA